MAAAKKGRRKHSRCSFLCSFASCFGVSNKVSADHSDRKSVSARRHGGGDIPVNDPSETAKTSTSEIHDVEQHEEEKKKRIAISSADQPINTSKRHENRDESSAITTSSIVKLVEEQNGAVNQASTSQRKLSHSVSLPPPHQRKQNPPPPAAAVGGEFDSTVGAVIASATLVVMVIWGKFWAIVCATAWFYSVPRIRAKMEESDGDKSKSGESEGVDFDSWEYKEKVVLEGLLHRNQKL
ncbi:hypothetical protein SASPL_119058 [Salvia splendens]|uniref:Transmembrane protein n=1 Tax=Salvia splendens TaxID=180675 RepID=A0A8X8ZZQ4_SALSN|nr:uncharacterized protein At5g23160-like [Salvia splendens]KAG6422486.1 hypothetical protein SASPL_119058 [Salvia splendens]